ncbi:hypothetical protein EJB05_07212, partial [Eragrostis curvula]
MTDGAGLAFDASDDQHDIARGKGLLGGRPRPSSSASGAVKGQGKSFQCKLVSAKMGIKYVKTNLLRFLSYFHCSSVAIRGANRVALAHCVAVLS